MCCTPACRYVEKRQAQLQSKQQELMRERCLQAGSMHERSQDFVELQVRALYCRLVQVPPAGC
jgi:hypothetical protein